MNRTVLRIADAISHIERNYTDKIQLQQLAEMTHFSVNQFRKIFRQIYQQSPINYLQQLELEKASSLLSE